MGCFDVKIKKIHNRSKANPVDQVSDGAREDHGQGNDEEHVFRFAFRDVINDQSHDQQSNADEKQRAKHLGHAGQKAEGGAGIHYVNKIKKTVNHRTGFMQKEFFYDSRFRDLIQHDDDSRSQNKNDNILFKRELLFLQIRQTAGTDGRMLRVGTDGLVINPAAFALGAAGFLNTDHEPFNFCTPEGCGNILLIGQLQLRHNQQRF